MKNLKPRSLSDIRVQLSDLLDKLEKVEENGFIEETVIIGAFADGLAYALGEELGEDYFAQANHLARKPREIQPIKSTWKVV